MIIVIYIKSLPALSEYWEFRRGDKTSMIRQNVFRIIENSFTKVIFLQNRGKLSLKLQQL